MRVLLYINGYLPKVGGRELVVHTLAKEMQELGIQVRVVGPGGFRKYRDTHFEYPLDRWFSIPGVSEETSWAFHLLRTRVLHRFDVIHAHTTYPTGYMACRFKRLLRVPVVITPHGADINRVPELNHGIRLDPVIDKKVRTALSGADATTAISKQIGHAILDAGADENKLTYIPNGVDIKRYQTKQTFNAKRWLGLSDDSKLIVSIGNYHPRKGHDVLVAAVREARRHDPSLALVIIGAKNEAFVGECMEGDRNADWLVFTGVIPLPEFNANGDDDLVAAILQQSHLYISASVDSGAEGMSLAVLEAMACGLPIIASDISGNSDLLETGKYGVLVEPGNIEALAKQIVSMFGNLSRMKDLAELAYERAQRMSWTHIAQQYVSLYKSLI